MESAEKLNRKLGILKTPEDAPNSKLRADIIKLSWPAAVELLLTKLINIFTMIMVSSLGKEAVSAVGISGQPAQIPNVIIQAFCVGGTAIVARHIGNHDEEGCRRTAAQTMGLCAGFALLATAFLYFFGAPIVGWMGATPDYFDMAVVYMKYFAFGEFFSVMTVAMASLFRGAGKTRLSMYFTVIANIVNVLVGYALIYGIGFFPKLGFVGACIAQLVGKIIGFCIGFYLITRKSDLPIRLDFRQMFKPHWETIKRIGRIGYATALEMAAFRIGMMAFTIYVVRLGTAEYAAHSIANSIYSYFYSVGQALGIGLVSLVGTNLGAGRGNLVDRYFKENLKICSIASAALMAALLVFPGTIASIFTKDPDVTVQLITAIRIQAFFVIANTFQTSLSGGLKGAGDTKWTLIANTIGEVIMRMVVGYVFINLFNWGIFGAWMTVLCEQYAVALVLLCRLRSGKWKNIKV